MKDSLKERYTRVFALADNLFENSTPEQPAWYSRPKHHRWDYVDGCMYKGAMDLYLATNDEKYLGYAKRFVDHYVEADGNISGYDLNEYNIDHINGGKVLFDLYRATGDRKYRQAAALLHRQLEDHPRTKSGNFWHKQIYPNQIWLDGLYMAQPFYVEHNALFGDKTACNDSMQQFRHVFEVMRDAKTGLFYHGYDESREMFWADKETGLSPNFWTRAMGWYAMALADTAEKLPEGFEADRVVLGQHLKQLVDAVLKFKSPKGLLYQVTDQGDRPGNYEETSGGLGFAYSMLKGARLGLLPQNYAKEGLAMFDSTYAEKLVTKDGVPVLIDTVLVSGLGGMQGKGDYKTRDGSFEYYISEPRVDNDGKGVAPLLYAMAEVLKLKQ